MGCLWFSIRLQKARLVEDFNLIFAGFGLIWFFVNIIILLHFQEVVAGYVPLFVIGAETGLTFAFYLVTRRLKSSIFTDPLNLSILLAHLMDASSTYISTSLKISTPHFLTIHLPQTLHY